MLLERAERNSLLWAKGMVRKKISLPVIKYIIGDVF